MDLKELHELALYNKDYDNFKAQIDQKFNGTPITAIDKTEYKLVKNLGLGGVSGSSLPLKIERVIVVAAQRWGKDYAGSTVGIIGREAIQICEKYGIDWENYR